MVKVGRKGIDAGGPGFDDAVEVDRVAAIGLDRVARLLGNQRRRDDLAGTALLGQASRPVRGGWSKRGTMGMATRSCFFS